MAIPLSPGGSDLWPGSRRISDTVDCLRDRPRSRRPRPYTAPQVAEIKAIACEQPAARKLPLSRFSLAEITLWIQHAAGRPRSARVASGASSTRPPFARGTIAVGCSRGIRTLAPKPGASWICTSACGKGCRSTRMITSSRPMRRVGYRCWSACTPRCHPARGRSAGMSLSMPGTGPWPTWRRSTSAADVSSGAWKTPPGSCRLGA